MLALTVASFRLLPKVLQTNSNPLIHVHPNSHRRLRLQIFPSLLSYFYFKSFSNFIIFCLAVSNLNCCILFSLGFSSSLFLHQSGAKSLRRTLLRTYLQTAIHYQDSCLISELGSSLFSVQCGLHGSGARPEQRGLPGVRRSGGGERGAVLLPPSTLRRQE